MDITLAYDQAENASSFHRVVSSFCYRVYGELMLKLFYKTEGSVHAGGPMCTALIKMMNE